MSTDVGFKFELVGLIGPVIPPTLSPDSLTHNELNMLNELLPTFSKETIQRYNFNDMTTDELVNLFSALSSPNLVKLFDELPHNKVINLLNKIPVDKRSSILNKLPLDKHQQYLK